MANDVSLGLAAIGEMGMLAGRMTSFENTEVERQLEKFRVWLGAHPAPARACGCSCVILGIARRKRFP